MMNVICLLVLALTPIGRIGIMGAMDVEIALLRESMHIERTDSLAERIFYVGELEEVECICTKAGIGKVNAALTAEMLIMQYGVEALVFTGVAGGINPQMEIGDIVISSSVIHHDFGQIEPEGFMPWDTVGYLADSMLIRIAREAADLVVFEAVSCRLRSDSEYFPQIAIGCVVTGDQFIASEEKRVWLEQTFDADCVEMEGAAVAQVCKIHRVPFVIIRSLSDLANEDADIDFELFVDYASKNSERLVKEMLKLLKD
jgi:adenosylhomocysteine nucleosidase